MANRRPAENLKGLRGGPRTIPAGGKGIAGLPRIEPQPHYIKAENENVLKNMNGSYIVLGRDRPKSRISGYGGRGETHCASIDIIAGRMSADGPMEMDEQGNMVSVDPSFEKDAARIYLSQKTDIDEYFDLVPGKVGFSQTRSGIGIKADAVRIMGREGIKLVTRPEAVNSQGGTIESPSGIDLIAGNDDTDLQPLVKGESLAKALERVIFHIGKLNASVNFILLSQAKFNAALTLHTHIGGTGPVSPSVELAIAGPNVAAGALESGLGLLGARTNMEMFKMNYLKPWGREYINSRYNNTN